jgi:tripartite-type tricarboxylate transporter receptor subunit TctC
VHCYFGSGELLTYSRSGQVRVLGSSGDKRSPAAPSVPTIGETVPGYVVESWQGIFAPAHTPPQIVDKMNAGIVKALEDQTIIKKLTQNAYAVTPSSPQALGKFLEKDTAKWSAIIKSAGLKID